MLTSLVDRLVACRWDLFPPVAREGRLPARGFWLVPFADLLQFGAQFVPFFSRCVDWNGHRARLGPGTIMIPVEPMAS
ncbi:MAG: hypothetical protein L6R30_21285 [Thermoanaerobaculia bacterium]|nr:hypothetical protein [Thermoanaerobaculia bacterium]